MSFPLVGNDRIKASVLASLLEKRLPHAILIEGEKGTGKKTLAGFLSFAAVCEGENSPCGSCKSCRLAQDSNHPDIAVIAPEDGKKNISVAQIRSLRNEVYVKPHMARCRVFIIEQADSMNEQAQNALLKVLEEPPAEIYFILIAEESSLLLDTVISRCTRLSLIPPEASVSAEYLSDNTDYNSEQINSALLESGGNIGEALRILGGGGTKAQAAAIEFTKFLMQGNDTEMLKITAPFEKSRVEADLFFKELRLAVAAEIRKNHKKPYTAKSLTKFYDGLSQFEDGLRTNINLSLLFCALVCSAAK